jgi:hypothetical protein
LTGSAASAVKRNGPLRLTSTVLSNNSGVTSLRLGGLPTALQRLANRDVIGKLVLDAP